MQQNKTRFLTGITPSGTPHLGNYAGSIRPAIAASKSAAVESFYFLADYHALIKCQDAARVHRSTLEIAASWLACGLDPEQVVFYRQSDIPEIPELNWLLTCVTGKGLLNRAHAYKAAQDKNAADAKDGDDGVTAGLFMYPVLMAADILMFNAHKVPVGRDQVQHLEMARDIASSFNHLYGQHFILPEVVIEESVATLPGLDGRKMSKSYDNTIPLFTPRAQLQKLIMGILTDSRAPGEAKSTEGSALFSLYQAFSSSEQTEQMRSDFAAGIAWGDAKKALFERIDAEIAPMREKYDALMANPEKVEAILQQGAQKARALSAPFIQQLRHAVGLRPLIQVAQMQHEGVKKENAPVPVFKQYREGQAFYFKLSSSTGEVLAQSLPLDNPRQAGQIIAACGENGAGAWEMLQPWLQEGFDEKLVQAALNQIQAAVQMQRDKKKG